jgi:hypothetical protein
LRRSIITERIVVDRNERDVLEVRQVLDPHQRIVNHDEPPADICRTVGIRQIVVAVSGLVGAWRI